MENHPIPQDITGFQFKLIGNMTIKQFAYLAAGVVIGWITFALPIPIIIKLPFAFLFGLTGISLAFLPFEGRPLDVMIGNFFNALFKPTQFVYQKTGGNFYCPPISAKAVQDAASQKPVDEAALSGEKLQSFLTSLPKKAKNKLDEREMVFFQSLAGYSQPTKIAQNSNPSYVPSQVFSDKTVSPQPPQPKIDEKTKTKTPEEKEENLEEEAKQLEQELAEAKKTEDQHKSDVNYQIAHQKVLDLEKLLNDTVSQKQALEAQLLTLHKKPQEEKKQQTYRPSLATPDVKEQTQNVHMVPKEMGKKLGMPIAPEFPNVVSGIVKDPRGNPLPNILVEVKDNEGNPVRAFKTNALGQFASATPLVNGTYTIEFEDPKSQNKFDAIEFTANGEIILPIEVISVDTREELRKSLFTNQ